MKKNYFLFILFAFVNCFSQSYEASPNLSFGFNNPSTNPSIQSSILTTAFLYDVGTAVGAQGNAGVVFINNQFWVSAWASNSIHLLSNTGAYISTFQVPGLTGTRSMTTDGTHVYCGTASTSIFKVDPVSKTLVSTIPISTTSNATARFCTYDASLNGGAGGFWIANFNTDIASVSMTGAQLSVIPAATHTLTGMYGAATYNNGGNHYLFVYHQAGTNNDQITVLNLANNTLTGDTYDFFANDASAFGSTSSLAGGMFLSTTVVPGENILVGVSQATPSNLLYGLNVNTVLENKSFSSSQFKVYPNPTTDVLNVASKNNNSITKIIVYDILGQEVLKKEDINIAAINISDLNSGIYYLNAVDQNNTSEIIKVVKK